jgi:hypothetical protein
VEAGVRRDLGQAHADEGDLRGGGGAGGSEWGAPWARKGRASSRVIRDLKGRGAVDGEGVGGLGKRVGGVSWAREG